MATLEIFRGRATWAMMRKVNVLVDDASALRIGNGATASVDVMPGMHTVAAKLDWTGSSPLEVECRDGSTTRVELAMGGFLTGLFRSLFAWNRVITLRLR